jgi:hypothetical protein
LTVAQRRVLADLENGRLRLVITERSTVALEPFGLEFETIEDAWDHVTMHPLEFPSDLYRALLERLNALRGNP